MVLYYVTGLGVALCLSVFKLWLLGDTSPEHLVSSHALCQVLYNCCVQPCYLLFLCSCSSLRVGLFWFVLLYIKTFTLQWVIYELFSILNSGRLKKYTSLRLDSLIPGHLGIINVSLIHAMRISLHIKEKLWVRLTYCYKSP